MDYALISYEGFSYGEGNKLHISTAHKHGTGAENRTTLERMVDGRTTNHIGLTLSFVNLDDNQTVPPTNLLVVQEAANIIEQEFLRARVALDEKARVHTVPMPYIGDDTAEGANDASIIGTVPGQSITYVTFRMPISAHKTARRIVRRINAQFQERYNIG